MGDTTTLVETFTRATTKQAVSANRQRIRGARGKRLLRQRGELLERPNAHLYETGGMRRVHLRGHPNILKRLLVYVCGVNVGLLLRQRFEAGTPRSLQGRAAVWWAAPCVSLSAASGPSHGFSGRLRRQDPPDSLAIEPVTRCHEHLPIDLRIGLSTTGCELDT